MLSGANIDLYSCKFKAIATVASSRTAMIRDMSGNLWNCYLDGVYCNAVTLDVYRGTVVNALHGFGTATFSPGNDVLLHDNGFNLYVRTNGTVTLRNVVGRSPVSAQLSGNQLNGTCILINADFDTWSISWVNSTGEFQRKYELDLRVTDEAGDPIVGATVLLEDKDGTQVFSVTTDSNGDIATQEVLHTTYNSDDTSTAHGPFTMTISKSGTSYLTQIHKLTLDEVTKEQISLTDVSDLEDKIDELKVRVDDLESIIQ